MLRSRLGSTLGDPYYATRRGVPGARDELDGAFVDLDAMLAQVPWLTGRSYGLADIAYLPWTLRARHLFGVSFAALPALSAWLARALERPAVAAEAAIVSTLPRLV